MVYRKTMYQRLLTIASIPSISRSCTEEDKVLRILFDEIAKSAYFKEHPEDLCLLPAESDPLKRNFLFAIVRTPERTEKTVLLTGHIDVVGVSDYGSLQNLAFLPERYTAALKGASLDEDSLKDLRSGKWLFGRGVGDMKSGVAAGVELLLNAAESCQNLASNLAVLFVSDEETSSAGMLGAVPWLAKLQDEGLRFICCIDLEPTFASGEEAKPTGYLGSLGKINPFFYCVGRDTHAGEYYDGFSVGPTAARITLALDGNTQRGDSLGETLFPPYAALKMADMRSEYSATILSKGVIAFSYLTAVKMPGTILKELKQVAQEALTLSIEEHRERRLIYRKKNNLPLSDANFDGTVLSVMELLSLAEKRTGKTRDRLLADALSNFPVEMDEREKALKTLALVVEELDLEGPLVIIGFLPPWYPHRVNDEMAKGDQIARQALYTLAEKAKDDGLDFRIRPLFEGVSDLSYCGFTGSLDDMADFEKNMPGDARLYRFPTESLLSLSIPVLNFGPIGKDFHRKTERIHLPFFLEKYPILLQYLVDSLGEHSDNEPGCSARTDK